MPAAPADIAKYTVDGIVLTNEDAGLRAAHSEAVDRLETPIEMFFANPAHGQAMLDEKFTILSRVAPEHEGIEVEENLRLGQNIAIAPTVPCMQIIDEARGIDVVARTRAYSYESDSDGFAVEVVR